MAPWHTRKFAPKTLHPTVLRKSAIRINKRNMQQQSKTTQTSAENKIKRAFDANNW